MRDFTAQPIQNARLAIRPSRMKQGDRMPVAVQFLDGWSPVSLGPHEEERRLTVCIHPPEGEPVVYTKTLGANEGGDATVIIDVDTEGWAPGAHYIEAALETRIAGRDLRITFPASDPARLVVDPRFVRPVE